MDPRRLLRPLPILFSCLLSSQGVMAVESIPVPGAGTPPQPSFSVIWQDPARSRLRWPDSGLGRLWAQPGMGALQKEVGQAFDRLAPNGGCESMLRDVTACSLAGTATPTGNGRWSIGVELPSTAGILLEAVDGKPVGPSGQMNARGWSWRWADGVVSAANSSEAPMLGASAEPSEDDVSVVMEIASLFREGDQAQQADTMEAVGLTHLDYGLSLCADGLRDRLVLPGFKLPFGSIESTDLAGIPEHPWALIALALDGTKLQSFARALQHGSRCRDAMNLYHQRYGERLGPLDDVLQGLTGTMTAVAVPAAPFPHVAVSVPSSPGWDHLVEGVLAVMAIDAQGVRDQALPIPLEVAWPSTLWIRRGDHRWALATDAALAESLAAPSSSTVPEVAREAIGNQAFVRIDAPSVAAGVVPFLAIAGANSDRTQQQRYALARVLFQAISRSSLAIDATVHVDADGTTVDGRAAIAALTLPSAAVIASGMKVSEAVDLALETATRRALTDSFTRALVQQWPQTMQLPPPGLVSSNFGDRPWALYLAPAIDAPADQPVIVVDPGVTPGKQMWVCHDGTIAIWNEAPGKPIWEAARRYASRPDRLTKQEWGIARAGFQAQDGDGTPFESVAGNIRFHVPGKPWHAFDPKTGGGNWLGVWERRGDMAFGIVVEQGTRTDSGTASWLLELSLDQKKKIDPDARVQWRGDASIDGIEAKRARLTMRVGSFELLYDIVMAAHNGYYYEIQAWCDPHLAIADAFPADVTGLIDRLQIVDRDRLSAALLPRSTRIPRLKIDLAGSDWALADPVENHMVELHLSSAGGSQAFLTAATVTGSPSDAALATGLLRILGKEFTTVHDQARVDLPIGTAMTFRYEILSEGISYMNRAWIVRIGAQALLATMFSPESAHIPDAIGDAFMRRLSLDGGSSAEGVADPKTDSEVALGIGSYYHALQRFSEALPFLLAAAERAPDDRECVRSVLECYNRLEQWDRGLTWYDAHAGARSEDFVIAAYKPWFLARMGEHERAVKEYATLFEAGYKDPTDFETYLMSLRALKRDAEAYAAFDAYPKLAADANGRRLLARLLALDGKGDDAMAVLRSASMAAPADEAAVGALINLELQLDRPTDARDTLVEALKRFPRSSRFWDLLGVSEYRLGHYRESSAALKHAIDVDPAAKDPRDLLAVVERMLGKGDTSLIASPIDAVGEAEARVPPMLVGAPAGGCSLLRSSDISWNPIDGFRRSDRVVIAITDRSACEAFSTLRFQFDPAFERFFVNRLIVRDATGTIATGSIDDWYVLDDNAGGPATSRKVASLPVPGLHPGCVIDCLVTTQQPETTDRMPFTVISLGSTKPAQHSIVTLTAPGDATVVHAGGMAEVTRSGDTWSVSAENVAAMVGEVLVPDTLDDLPIVVLGARTAPGADWSTLGTSYLDELRPIIDDPLPEGLAPPPTDGAANADQRIAAIVRFVQRTVVYNAVEFGRRGRIPQSAARTLGRRLGDCKDQAVLTHVLLARAGIVSHLALVPRYAMAIGDMPDLDQFNHMVVAIPGSDSFRIIDPTAQYLDPKFCPSGEAGCGVLILDPAEPRLAVAPVAGSSRCEVDRSVNIDAEGKIRCDEMVDLTGYFAESWRSLLAKRDREQWRAAVQEQFGSSVAGIDIVEASSVDDPSIPLHLHLAYALHDRLHQQEAGLVGRISDPWSVYSWSGIIDRNHPRVRPLNIKLNLDLTVTSRYLVPTGMRLRSQSEPTTDHDDFFSYSETPATGTDPVNRRRMIQIPGQHAATRYSEWCDRADDLLRRAALEVTVTRDPP